MNLMLNTRRKERNQIRPHVLKIVSDGYGWGDATKIIENTFKVSLSNAIRDIDLAFEIIVERLEHFNLIALRERIYLGRKEIL